MPQMSPMLWMVLIVLMLASYLFLLNSMPKFPMTSMKNKNLKNKKIGMMW